MLFAIRSEKVSNLKAERLGPGGLNPKESTRSYPNTGLFAELVALRIAKVVVRIETRVQCGNQVEQRLSRDCITKVSTFSIFVTVTEASAGTVGERKRVGFLV